VYVEFTYNTLDAVLQQWHRAEEMLTLPRSKAISLLLLLLQWSGCIKDLKYYIPVISTDM